MPELPIVRTLSPDGSALAGRDFSHRGDTFRSTYTVRFTDRVFVLHAFQKKSKSGIATPKAKIPVKLALRDAVTRSHDAEQS